MNRVAAALLATAAVMATAPPLMAETLGQARQEGRTQHIQQVRAQLAQLDQLIRRGLASGAITPSEAGRVQGELKPIRRMNSDMLARNWRTVSERLELVERGIHWRRGDGRGRR